MGKIGLEVTRRPIGFTPTIRCTGLNHFLCEVLTKDI
jgi:hypothetical protein